MSVSDVVCMASAHLSCCTLEVLGLRVVVVVVAVNIDAEGCCSYLLVSGGVCMVEVQGDTNDVSVTCRGVIAGCHHRGGQ